MSSSGSERTNISLPARRITARAPIQRTSIRNPCCHLPPALPAERRLAISKRILQRSGECIAHVSANDRRAVSRCTLPTITFIRRIVLGRPQEEEFQVALHIPLHHEQGVRTQ